MDVDRDKHFSVSDLQVLEEEDNRVSGQALKKNTSFWYRLLLLQQLFSTRVSPHVVFANWFNTASFWGPFLRVSMGLTDRRKTAKNLVDSRKN